MSSNAYGVSPTVLTVGALALGGIALYLMARPSSGLPSRSTQVRPFPANLDTVTDAVRAQYFGTAQTQLYALRFLPNLTSFTWGQLDDTTEAALRAFAQSDPALLARVHAAGPTHQTTMVLDALDTAFRARATGA